MGKCSWKLTTPRISVSFACCEFKVSIDILIQWHLSIHWVQQYLFVLTFNQQKSSTKLCGYRPISFGNETLFHLCTLLCISTPQFLNSFTTICTKLTKTIFLLPSQKTLTKCISPVIAEENSKIESVSLSFFFFKQEVILFNTVPF